MAGVRLPESHPWRTIVPHEVFTFAVDLVNGGGKVSLSDQAGANQNFPTNAQIAGAPWLHVELRPQSDVGFFVFANASTVPLYEVAPDDTASVQIPVPIPSTAGYLDIQDAGANVTVTVAYYVPRLTDPALLGG